MTKRAATAAIALVLLTLMACGVTQPLSSSPSLWSDAPPNEVSGVDIPAGRIDDAVARVDGLVADLMRNSGIPGMSVAIVHGGKTLYAKGFGVKDASKGAAADNKVDADTVFQLASISKAIGATVVAHQVTENAITWDTPVASKLPWFTLSDPYVSSHVTVAPGCPTTPATNRRTWATTANRRWSGSVTCRWRPFETATPTPTSE
jgi:CubicO group peptidase (beta-lactamase class C family)